MNGAYGRTHTHTSRESIAFPYTSRLKLRHSHAFTRVSTLNRSYLYMKDAFWLYTSMCVKENPRRCVAHVRIQCKPILDCNLQLMEARLSNVTRLDGCQACLSALIPRAASWLLAPWLSGNGR